MNIKILPAIIDFLLVLFISILLYIILLTLLPHIENFISNWFYKKELISTALLTGFWWIIIPYLISLCLYKYTINIAYLSIFIYTFSVFNFEKWNPSHYFFIFMMIISFLILGWTIHQMFIKKSRKSYLWIPLIIILYLATIQIEAFISSQAGNSNIESLQNIISFLLWWIFGLFFNFIAIENKKDWFFLLIYKKLRII